MYTFKQKPSISIIINSQSSKITKGETTLRMSEYLEQQRFGHRSVKSIYGVGEIVGGHRYELQAVQFQCFQRAAK